MADTQAKSMAQKRERHYPESRMVLSVAMILFGVCSAVCLLFIWPQRYSELVFNSRLAYKLILDVEDYFTCSLNFQEFVIDEPEPEDVMHTIYIFNVTNAANVFQQGYRPNLVETGPYGFSRYTYKYDISFDPDQSTYVTFKEYSVLREITDPTLCKQMYFRLERNYAQVTPCVGDTCLCKSIQTSITTINPLFFKILWEDTPFEMIARYSVDVFKEIKRLLDKPFSDAVRAQLVSYAWQEIFSFRVQMQIGILYQVGFNDLLMNYSFYNISSQIINPTECGMEAYGIPNCRFPLYSLVRNLANTHTDINSSYYPNLAPILNASSNISFLNLEYGLPKYLGFAWYFGYAEFNSKKGYTMISRPEILTMFNELVTDYARSYFGVYNLTASMILGTQRVVKVICQDMAVSLITPYSVYKSNLNTMAYHEFESSYTTVPCSPQGLRCLWQYGYLKHLGVNYNMSDSLAYSLIDIASAIPSNPNNLFMDSNAPILYNDYIYCTEVYHPKVPFNLSCTAYSYTFDDALINRPAGLWGIDYGVSAINRTRLYAKYKSQPASVKAKYFHYSCNISILQYSLYREATDFHDEYVIRYLNKYSKKNSPDFSHNFTIGNWSELGWAQFGAGVITNAISSVPTINMLVRNGMWRFGNDSYYNQMMEYSSWSVLQGYPDTWLYDIYEAKTLLDILSDPNDTAVEFRRNVMYTSTTFIGDGVHYDNGVGDIGDITFSPEFNIGNFSCTGDNEAACSLMDVFFTSSAEFCQEIEAMYDNCRTQISNHWLNSANCVSFQTSITSPTSGIQCNTKVITGFPHPYTKSRGNIVARMIYSQTLTLKLMSGLWCNEASQCNFNLGGMFVTTTPRRLLFEGYTDPAILNYLDLKYGANGVTFECAIHAYDQCGFKNYNCDPAYGLNLVLPNNTKKLLLYNSTPYDEYFAPYFEITSSSELLWPYAIDPSVAKHAEEVEATQNVLIVNNPMFAIHPGWDSENVVFNKYYQCQKRVFSGYPNKFQSCYDTLYTGSDFINNTLNLKLFHGNGSTQRFPDKSIPVNGSTVRAQQPMHLWEGFSAYPYSYLLQSAGKDRNLLKLPSLFSKLHVNQLTLSQSSLLFDFQRQITVGFPLPTTAPSQSSTTTSSSSSASTSTTSNGVTIKAKRYVEDYANSWQPYKELSYPNDSYGMEYQIPIGMASMQSLASYPVFYDTPHSYGNLLWGGLEYTQVSGTQPNQYSQRTFIDYDPVTGRSLRSAFRQQVTLRVEANALLPLLFSSQARCVAPTKSYTDSTGYGCFAYIPLYWFEESKVASFSEMQQLNSHFYERPVRASTFGTIGIVFGSVFIFFGGIMLLYETYQRRRFKSRVYID